jgi:hypothetical protein
MIGDFRLQTALAASSATADSPTAGHHPVACKDGGLSLHEDGRFACDHAVVGPDDPRTQQAIDHSVALLLIELALDR